MRLCVGKHVFDEVKSMYLPMAAITSCFFVLMRRYCISFCERKIDRGQLCRERELVD